MPFDDEDRALIKILHQFEECDSRRMWQHFWIKTGHLTEKDGKQEVSFFRLSKRLFHIVVSFFLTFIFHASQLRCAWWILNRSQWGGGARRPWGSCNTIRERQVWRHRTGEPRENTGKSARNTSKTLTASW